jgi:hypothetical protein
LFSIRKGGMVMSTTATFVERRKLADRRGMKVSSIDGERRKELISKIEQVRNRRKFGLIFKLLSSLIVICIGIAIFVYTGLYDAVESTALKIILGLGIPYYLVVTFLAGLKVADREK